MSAAAGVSRNQDNHIDPSYTQASLNGCVALSADLQLSNYFTDATQAKIFVGFFLLVIFLITASLLVNLARSL